MRQKIQYLSYYRWLVFGVTVLGTFMGTIDSSIVNVALPLIAERLEAELTIVQWVVTAYLLTISSLLPLFGRAGDMFGRKLVYMLGFFVFTIGSIVCGLSINIWMLIGARVLQAIGAAMLMANSPAIIGANFPGKERGRALGMVGTVVALGLMTGPGMGGLLAGAFGWQSIFIINVPIGITAFILAYLVLPADAKRKHDKFDFIGAFFFACAMVSLLLIISNGQRWGWLSTAVISGGVVTVIFLTLFIWQERRVKYPMIDLSLFQSWQFLSGNLSSLLSFMAIFINVMLLPFYLHSVLELTPTQIGIIITPFPLTMAIVAPISGYLSERFSFIVLTVSGLVITMSGLLYMATLNSASAIWQVAVGQAIIGVGNGLFQSPNSNSVLSSVPPDKLGIASGINALVRNIGMVSGIALAVTVFETRRQQYLTGIVMPTPMQLTDAFLTGYHAVLIVGACIAGAAAIISLNRRGYVRA